MTIALLNSNEQDHIIKIFATYSLQVPVVEIILVVNPTVSAKTN
jgi:hypothetical protein